MKEAMTSERGYEREISCDLGKEEEQISNIFKRSNFQETNFEPKTFETRLHENLYLVNEVSVI